MESPRHVSDWQKFSLAFQHSLVLGDLVEVNYGPFSHWTMYYKDGLIVDFDSAEERDEKYEEEPFRSGVVKSGPLKVEAGEYDIRVNNKPEYEGTVRPVHDSQRLMELLPNSPGIRYSGRYFNCQVFVTFLKFQGNSDEEQQKLVEAIENGQLKKVCAGVSRDGILRKLANVQWEENAQKKMVGEIPRRLFEQGLEEWDNQ